MNTRAVVVIMLLLAPRTRNLLVGAHQDSLFLFGSVFMCLIWLLVDWLWVDIPNDRLLHISNDTFMEAQEINRI